MRNVEEAVNVKALRERLQCLENLIGTAGSTRSRRVQPKRGRGLN